MTLQSIADPAFEARWKRWERHNAAQDRIAGMRRKVALPFLAGLALALAYFLTPR